MYYILFIVKTGRLKGYVLWYGTVRAAAIGNTGFIYEPQTPENPGKQHAIRYLSAQ